MDKYEYILIQIYYRNKYKVWIYNYMWKRKKSTELNTSIYTKMIYSSIICIPTSLHTHINISGVYTWIRWKISKAFLHITPNSAIRDSFSLPLIVLERWNGWYSWMPRIIDHISNGHPHAFISSPNCNKDGGNPAKSFYKRL